MFALRHRFSLRRSSRVPLAVGLLLGVAFLLSLAGDATLAQNGPLPLDHFLCYPFIFAPEADTLRVSLQDQFDIELGFDLPEDQGATSHILFSVGFTRGSQL